MNTHIYEQIIQELYTIDPSLKQHDARIREAIIAVMNAKEQITVDDAFVASLKQRVLAAYAQPKHTWYAYHQLRSSLTQLWSMHAGMVVASSLAVLVVAGGIVYMNTKQPYAIADIQVAGYQAFGSFTSTDIPFQGLMISPRGDLGGSGEETTDAKISATMDERMMIWTPAYTLEYAYVGDEFQIPERLSVYKHNASKAVSDAFGKQIQSAIKPFFSQAMEGIGVTSLTFTSAKKDYQYEMNIENGTAAVYSRIPRPYDNAHENKLIANDDAIQIARQFLANQGVSIDKYGEPFVDETWKQYVPESADIKEYAPIDTTVIFPLIIDGNSIHSLFGGAKQGMQVLIDNETKRVLNVYGISFASYASSIYDTENDFNRLLNIAKYGGSNPIHTKDIPVYTAQIGTPEIVYIEYYLPQEQLVYMPALRFPVFKGDVVLPEYETLPPYIVVPLLDDLLDQLELPLEIMPFDMMK